MAQMFSEELPCASYFLAQQSLVQSTPVVRARLDPRASRAGEATLKRVLTDARILLLATLFALTACASPYVQATGQIVAIPQLILSPTAGRGFVQVSDGARLPVQVWAPPADDARPRAVIVGVHGFNDYLNTFAAAGSWWADHGILTYAYDQRGFGAAPEPGKWPGQKRMVRDLESVVAAVRERHPRIPVFLHGNSMGGAVVLLALSEQQLGGDIASVRGAILTAPAVWGGSTMNPVYRITLWIAAHTVPSQSVTGRALGILPSDNIEMLRALGRDPLVIKETCIDSLYGLVGLMGAAQRVSEHAKGPLLVLYGAKDGVIPRPPISEMAAKLAASARFVVYPAGYHMLLRDLQAQTVWRDIAAWIDDTVAPLPSGKEVSGTKLFGAQR
jgi:acylglycerol lipase